MWAGRAPGLSLTAGPPVQFPRGAPTPHVPAQGALSHPNPGSPVARCPQQPQPAGGSPRPPRLSAWESGPPSHPEASSPQSEPITSWATRNAMTLPEGMVTVFFRLRWPWPWPWGGHGLRAGLRVVGPGRTGDTARRPCPGLPSSHRRAPAAHLQGHSSRKGKLARALLLVGPRDLHLLLRLEHLRHHEHIVPATPQLLQDFVLRLPQAPAVSGPAGSSQVHAVHLPCPLPSSPPLWGTSFPPPVSLCARWGWGDAAKEPTSSADAQARNMVVSPRVLQTVFVGGRGCRKKGQGPAGTGRHLQAPEAPGPAVAPLSLHSPPLPLQSLSTPAAQPPRRGARSEP